MESTREKVLKILLTNQQSTINELAEAVGINPISVRHHVSKLEATGLIESEEVRHGVGRPRRVYSLSVEGMERFPTRYMQLTLRLLEQLKETLPAETVNKIFKQMANELLENYTKDLDLEGLPVEERLNIVKELLHHEGFTVEWEKTDNSYLISEVSCPYYHIGQSHPEVCSVDQSLISSVLSVPVEKVTCILDGDKICTYVVPLEQIDTMENQ